MTTQPDPLNSFQRSCAEKIHAVLVRMHNHYAQNISEKCADDWLREVEVFMIENGILVMTDAGALPDEVLAVYLQGDSFHALQIVECWLMAIRGALDWPTAFAEMEKFPKKPGDVGLVIAVANAFGKAERYLNQKEENICNSRKGGSKDKNRHKEFALTLFDKIRPAVKSDNKAFENVIAEIDKRFRDAPSVKTVRTWVNDRRKVGRK